MVRMSPMHSNGFARFNQSATHGIVPRTRKVGFACYLLSKRIHRHRKCIGNAVHKPPRLTSHANPTEPPRFSTGHAFIAKRTMMNSLCVISIDSGSLAF